MYKKKIRMKIPDLGVDKAPIARPLSRVEARIRTSIGDEPLCAYIFQKNVRGFSCRKSYHARMAATAKISSLVSFLAFHTFKTLSFDPPPP